jgi:hypothetical protein
VAGGRILVDDSKKVYSGSHALRRLEEGVLSFWALRGSIPETADALLAALDPAGRRGPDPHPWFAGISELQVPVSSNRSAVDSKSAALAEAARRAELAIHNLSARAVLPEEFNRIVTHTRNKSFLLFQECGVLLRQLWRESPAEECFVLVDRHGGRMRYRKLLHEAFPACGCDVLREGTEGSVYRLSDGQRTMTLAFKRAADALALPTALASMTAKYVRELYMRAFNRYWQQRRPGLRPTAGYARDARRFLAEIRELLAAEGADMDAIVRSR